MEAQLFFGDKPNEPRSWFQKSFSQANTQMSQPLLNMKGPSPKNGKPGKKFFFMNNSISNLKLSFFPYCFLLARRAQKTGGARATTTLLFWWKRKVIKKKMIICFYLCLVGGFPEGDSHHWLFFLGFLLESGQRPLAGQTWIQNLSQLLKYQSTCNKEVNPKTKNLQMKNQRFQSWRL